MTNRFDSNVNYLCGRFTETGLMRMLQAIDYDLLEKTSPFFRVFAK